MKFWEKYEILRGYSLLHEVIKWIIMVLIFELVFFFLLRYAETIIVKTGTEAGFFAFFMFFAVNRNEEYKSIGKKSRIILTYKNSYEIYKTFYLTEYVIAFCFMLLFIIGENIIASYLNYPITLLASLGEFVFVFLMMAIIPFVYTMKNKYAVWILLYFLIVAEIVICNLPKLYNLITVVITTCVSVVLIIISNKRWLKLMKNKYFLKNCD